MSSFSEEVTIAAKHDRKKAKVMKALPSRRKRDLDAGYDKQILHTLSDAVKKSKDMATASFDETMEFHARLGIDPKYC